VKDWMTTKEAGDYLGVSDSRIRQLIRKGRLSPERVGHIHLLPREQVEAFARQQEEDAPKKPGPRPNVMKQPKDDAQ
jgi:excisionase family DNA binding protein